MAGLSPRLHIMKTSSGGKRELRKEGLGSGWAKGKDLLHIHQPIKKKKRIIDFKAALWVWIRSSKGVDGGV